MSKLQTNRNILLAAIVACGMLAFAATLKLGFIWDDPQMIVSNIYIRSWTLMNIGHHFLSDVFNQGLNYYRPLQTISNAFDFTIWKLNPFGYHLTNLLLHLFNACLVFFLAGELGLSIIVSAVAGALFAVNPIVVEQLIVIAGKAEIMTLTFTLLSILAFLKKGRGAYILSLLSFILAMLAKESGVITPFLTALVLFARKEKKERYLKLLPFLLFIPPYLYLRQLAVGAALEKADTVLLLTASAAYKLPKIICYYLYNTLLPVNLHSHHLQPSFGMETAIYFFAVYLLIAWAVLSKNRLLIFSIFWYILALAPKIPALLSVRNDYMLDHWVYPSNIALMIGAALLFEKYLHKGDWRKKAAIAGLGLVMFFYIYESNLNIYLRGSDTKIYEHAIQHTTSYQARYNLARNYYLSGRLNEALELIKPVILKEPTEIHLNGLALILARMGDEKGAAKILDALMKTEKPSKETFFNRAMMYDRAGNRDRALKTMKAALELYPDYSQGMVYIADALRQKGANADAEALYARVLAIDPYDLSALIALGTYKAQKGLYPEARALWQKALEISPGDPAALQNLKKLNDLTQQQ